MTNPAWTHESVKLIAADGDPIAAVRARARQLVTKAIDEGWSGPPFDPIALATKHLGLELVATDEVADARTVPTPSGARIEFNPNRPRERRRYSVAHEIAHTLFPDFADRVRHRGSHHADVRPEDWQLETLCNIAAAEILMPVGSMDALSPEAFSIDLLTRVRPQFDVSMEAVLIRAVQVADFPCAVFAASRIESGANAGRYRVQYSIAAAGGPVLQRGALLPPTSVVSECTAIGFTAKGSETWSGDQLRVECVGIPPFPGASFPRVAGVLRRQGDDASQGIQFVTGDVLQPRGIGHKLVVHLVNDATPNWGGRGVAIALKKRWPAVQRDFQTWASARGSLKLGEVRFCHVDTSISVASLVAQRGYGPSPIPRIRYSALEACLKQVALRAAERSASVHMPRIGTGYGGGVWAVIQEIITAVIIDAGICVTVYDLPDQAPAAQPSLL